MLHVQKLHYLVTLDLSHNHLVCIEGLKELRNLRRLILAHNNIKTIEHLHTNIHLELLDLSHNAIQCINNLSPLIRLKILHLSSNKLSHLRHCNLYLPSSITCLSLNSNTITDLSEISHLVHLTNLEEVSIGQNPCLSHSEYHFDYRPFIINWCSTIKIIDKIPVTKMECLKAEWLYSQGRGRKFHVGQHEELVQYLSKHNSQQCNGGVHHEEEKKLKLVLSKAHMHQKQLKEEQYYVNDPELMTRSLDPYILQGSANHTKPEIPSDLALSALSRSIACPASAPLPTATTLLPVPESLNSPMVTNIPSLPSSTSTSKLSITQEEDFSSSSCSSKLKAIHRSILNKNNGREQDPDVGDLRDNSMDLEDAHNNGTHDVLDENKAALIIQKFWRGYKARNLDKNVTEICQTIQTQRINKYVHQLLADMAATREALACEHQLQVLQLQAINALWNKMVTQQPCNVQRCACLSQTIQYEISSLKNVCEELKNQVAEIKNINNPSIPSSSAASINATAQTDIVAVQTPVGDAPSLWRRPCTLPEQLRTTVINDVLEKS